jgi:ElaA protein
MNYTISYYNCVVKNLFCGRTYCVYLDLDGKDKVALHLFCQFEGKDIAHARLFKSHQFPFDNSIGRVVVDADYRDRKCMTLCEAIAGIAK